MNTNTFARALLSILAAGLAAGCTAISYKDQTSGASFVYLSLGTDRKLGAIRAKVDGDKKDVTIGASESAQSVTASNAIDAARSTVSPITIPQP
jgi:hypothetical protein